MEMNAVLFGDECTVSPTKEWVDEAVQRLPLEQGDQFFCLMRSEDDQMNVLWDAGGYRFEWYLVPKGGALAAYRAGEGYAHHPQRKKGFLASLFAGRPSLVGSLFNRSEAAAMLNAYVDGAQEFPNLDWKPIYS